MCITLPFGPEDLEHSVHTECRKSYFGYHCPNFASCSASSSASGLHSRTLTGYIAYRLGYGCTVAVLRIFCYLKRLLTSLVKAVSFSLLIGLWPVVVDVPTKSALHRGHVPYRSSNGGTFPIADCPPCPLSLSGPPGSRLSFMWLFSSI